MEVIRDYTHGIKMPKARRVRGGNTCGVWGNLIVLQCEPLLLPFAFILVHFA